MSAVRCYIVKHEIYADIPENHDYYFLGYATCCNFDFYINEVNKAVISNKHLNNSKRLITVTSHKKLHGR